MSRPPTGSGPVAGACIPHAPLLLLGVGGGSAHMEVAAIRQAASRLDFEPVDVVVVLSPHGPHTGVYASSSGDLSGFGVEGVTIEFRRDPDASDELAAGWGVPLIDDPVDYGVLVPLNLMGSRELPVVGACLDESDGASTSAGVAGFAAALMELARSHRVLFVASVNTSAGLTPRAPLTELPGAPEIEARLVPVLESDPGLVNGLATELESVGSCSRGPLTAFGALFAGRPAHVLAHVWPFGVGYMVAAVGNRISQ